MLSPRSALLLYGVRAVFWLTVLLVLLTAAMPSARAPHLSPWDKAEHFAAFFVLTGLAAAAYPRASLMPAALWLSLFGCTIELAQALPIIHRDCDIGGLACRRGCDRGRSRAHDGRPVASLQPRRTGLILPKPLIVLGHRQATG